MTINGRLAAIRADMWAEILRQVAKEIRAEDLPGWGNACADAADEIERLAAENEQLRSTAAYLVAEVESDWEKGRISVDAYHAALHCKKHIQNRLSAE